MPPPIENSLRQLLPSAGYVHLATHGFFADPKFHSDFGHEVQGEQLSAGAHELAAGLQTGVTTRNPLLLSGIVLAGANLPPQTDSLGLPTGQDGILTAEEIVSLDLRNTELVVLSACDTGLGPVAGGEGVMGLTRAFHLAGARNVVASLWKVDDRATAVLMRLFYHHLWTEKPPIEALRQAQLTLYRRPELLDDSAQLDRLVASRGLDVNRPLPVPAAPPKPSPGSPARTTPARHWAAFILSGPGH